VKIKIYDFVKSLSLEYFDYMFNIINFIDVKLFKAT